MMGKILRMLSELIYPKRATCMGCGAQWGIDRDWLCSECRRALAESWVGAGTPPQELEAAAYAYVYRAPASGLVQRLKYGGVWKLTEFMGRDMAAAYRFIEPTAADCVTFVPMHPKRQDRRGYNHAELLARDVAGRIGLPCEPLLKRVRNTRQQAKSDAAARRINLKGAFELCADVEGRRILLVDDVCTTGSTASECATVLRRSGAKSVMLLCYTIAPQNR